MHLRLFLGFTLASCTGLLHAQVSAPPSAPAAPAANAQDPDRPKKSVAEQMQDLARDQERLEREIAFVRERAAKSSALLREKFAARGLHLKPIDAGTSAIALPAAGNAAPQIKRARLMDEAESKQHADALFVVDGRPVTKAMLDPVLAYLGTFPAAGDADARQQRASMEVIRVESMLAAVKEQAEQARQQIEEALGKIRGGMSFADAAKTYSRGPGLLQDGKVTVTHFSPFGIGVESAAFAAKEGALIGPIAAVNGYTLLQVDKLVKGETPDGDQVEARIIQIPYHPDPNEMQQIRDRSSIGKVDVIARDKAAMALLPAFLRPIGSVVPPAPGNVNPKAEQPEEDKPKAKTDKDVVPLKKIGG